MASNLTGQVRNIADVATAIARGDLSRKITVDVKGEILELKNTINTMVDQLNGFASEVSRVAREVGTEGKLGGQAQVPGVAGTWKDLTDNVNVMAANLTEQVRGIVKVVTAVANGDLKQNLTVKAKGEVAALAETINNMTQTLATFADQVTTVAREVGVDHLILLSSVGAGRPVGAYLKAKARAEALVTGSGLAWTILRPSAFEDRGGQRLPGARAVMRFLGLPKWELISLHELSTALLRVACARAPLEAVLEGRTLWDVVAREAAAG